MSLAELCTSTATIQRPTYTADAQGGQVATFAAVYTNIPVTYQPANGRTIERFGARSLEVDGRFYSPVAVTLQAGDRVVVGSDEYIVRWWEDQGGRGEVYAIWTKKIG